MQTGISGKTALVTGSTQGIGFATARLLAQEGARVVIHGRGGDKLNSAIDNLRKSAPGADIAGVGADLSTESGVAQLVHAVPAADILVNGYADFSPMMLTEMAIDDWTPVLRNNLGVTSAISTHYFAGMRENGWGRIVFISSDLALRPLPFMIPYSAAKMGQLTLARGLAEMTVGTEVTVNSVMPGFTQTERTEALLRMMADKHKVDFEKFIHDYFWDPACPWVADVGHPGSLLRRLLDPQEVANLIVYLCSRLSSATNGATLRCDGGATMTAI